MHLFEVAVPCGSYSASESEKMNILPYQKVSKKVIPLNFCPDILRTYTEFTVTVAALT
jgi:hypothetical protein